MIELHIKEIGGIMPTSKNTLWEIAEEAYESSPAPAVDKWGLLQPYSAGIKCYKNGNNIIVGIRGTADMRDIKADLQIVYSGITKSSRYKSDLSILKQIQEKYKPPLFKYYSVSHSLGSAIADELIHNGYIQEGVSYNGAVDLLKFKNGGRNHRIYNEDDILYNLMGRFTTNPEVRKNKISFTQRALNLIPLGKLGNSVKAHLLSNFKGGFHVILS